MSETRLCGIDSSTQKTGISLFVNGEYKDSILINHSNCKDSELRVNMMIHSIIEKLNEWKPQIIAIEDDWNKQNVQVTKALSEITGIKFEKVASYSALPTVGVSGVIYLVPKTTTALNNVYTEYYWTGSDYDMLGDTTVDLSGYLTINDVAELAESEVKATWESVFGTVTA